MINITHCRTGHNRPRAVRKRPHAAVRSWSKRACGFWIACALIGLGSGAAAPTAAADCPVKVDDDAWRGFQEIARRLAAGEQVSQDQLASLFAKPAYALLLETMGQADLNPHILTRVMEHVFSAPGPQGGERPQGRRNAPKRTDLVDCFGYAHDHADSISALIQRFQRDEFRCRIFTLASEYIRGERLPRQLTLSFLVAGPEIRLRDNHLLVDVGLAVASDPDQLCRILASVLYRDLEAPSSPEPFEAATGAEALKAAFERMAYHGIAGWIEDYPNVVFDPHHPTFGKAQTWRKDTLSGAPTAFESVNKYLALMFTDPESVEKYGRLIDEVVRGASTYDTVGYAMAALIVARFGPERLSAVTLSAAEFLRAYQEAALIPQIIEPEEVRGDFTKALEDMPALPAAEYGLLMNLLTTGSAWQ